MTHVASTLARLLAAAPAPTPAPPAAVAPESSAFAGMPTTLDGWTSTIVSYAPKVVGALLLLFVAFVLAGWVRRLVNGAMTRGKVDATLTRFMSNIVRWLVLVVAVLACLETFGVRTTSFAAVIGAAGLAVGLGFQGSLANLAAGVMLLVFRPFKIGDAVVAGGQAGIVDAIDLFTTTLDTPDNRRIFVPNSAITSGTIENSTFHARRRVEVRVLVDPTSDVAAVRRVLTDAAGGALSRATGALRDPAPDVNMVEVTPPTWAVGMWAQTASLLAVRGELVSSVKQAMDAANIGPKPVPPTVIRA